MWFPATTNCVMSLQSPAGELIWVSRWTWVIISPITATPVQLTFWFQTGSWASQQLLTCLSHLHLILQLFWNNRSTHVAALTTELRKHSSDDTKCKELYWVCVPLVVESYGAWGKEALESISQLASRLATCSSKTKSVVLTELYGRLNLHLVRANAIAILSRSISQSDVV